MAHQKKINPAWPECAEEWETHGGYMAAKKAKLEEQFHDAVKKEFTEYSTIFHGVAIFVNGYTNPSAEELKRLMMAHGGVYHYYLRTNRTTHMIATNLPYSKILAYRKAKKPLPLCKPEWITDSIKAGKLLDYRNYLLYSQCTETQPAIFAHMQKKASSTITSNNSTANNSTNVNSEPEEVSLVQAKPTSSNNSLSTSLMHIVSKNEVSLQQTKALTSNNLPSSSESPAEIVSKAKEVTVAQSKPNTELPSAIANSTKNPEFLTEFYNNSRLHHISTMGAIFKDYINDLRDKSEGKFPGLEYLKKQAFQKQFKPGPSNRIDVCDSDDELFGSSSDDPNKNPKGSSTEKKPIIMHIDMDCFFVSVGLRDHPELRGTPVAVAHAKGNKVSDDPNEYGSMSEVASCSYEARKAGVKNGMFLGKALKLCPNLKTIRYNFEAYKEVSYALYDTVASYTLDIEAVSCDEMYVDCTKILKSSGLNPLEFAFIIREEIKEKTGCPVSTGFGENKLQARLATKKAKPNGQHYLKGNEMISFIRALNVRDLPGVGYSTSQKLYEMDIKTCGDLEAFSLYELQKEFGKKSGQQLYEMCRGIDQSKLNLEHVRKSVSAEVNYGIRFENTEAAHEFLRKLSSEVSDRLKKISCKGKSVTLKVMFRAKEAPNEPRKFMGHGICDAYNKSKNLIAPTDDPVLIAREVITLWNQFQQSPEDARGVGIQMTKLESLKDKSKGSTILKFFDKAKAKQETNQIEPVNHITKIVSIEPEVDEIKLNQLNEKPQLSNESLKSGPVSSLEDPFNLGEIELDYDIQKKNEDFHETSHSIEKQLIYEIDTDSSSSNNSEDKNTEQKLKHSSQLKQTKQMEFFKKTKSASNRMGKVKLPDIQEIDMKVLIELPEDIRNEILNEYKENKDNENHTNDDPIYQEPEIMKQPEPPIIKNQQPEKTLITKKKQTLEIRQERDISFSQVDPDFLAALPDDVRNEVKSYCDAKKKAKTVSHSDSGWNMFKNENKIQKNINLKTSKGKGRPKGSSNRGRPRKDMTPNIAKSVPRITKDVGLVSDKTTEKVQEKQVEEQKEEKVEKRKSFYFDNENGNSEHNEILSELVTCLLELPITQVKKQILEWIRNNSDVNDVDFLSMTTYLGTLPRKKRIFDLRSLLRFIHRHVQNSESCVWHDTYRKMLNHIQPRMRLEYGYKLLVPEEINCNKCNLS